MRDHTLGAVSVVIPTYPRARFITGAVESVLPQLGPGDEVLVVDDGSTDGTPEKLARFGNSVRVILQDHQGAAAARNRGVAEARGEWVAFLDSDDWWLPGRLERHLALMSSDERAVLGVGHVMVADEADRICWQTTLGHRHKLDAHLQEEATFVSMLRSPAVYPTTLVAPRELLAEMGPFDSSLPAAEDWDFFLRAVDLAPITVLPWPPLAVYRLHAGNTPGERMARGTLAMTARHLSKPASREARAALLAVEARAQRTLCDQGGARGSALRAFSASWRTAITSGATRQLLTSVLPAAVVTRVRRRRSETARSKVPERIDPEETVPGIVAHHLVKYQLAARQIGRGRVLDIGCGVGYGSKYLAKEGTTVVGIDVAPEALDVARKRYSGPGVAFALADGARLPFNSASFDAVTCLEAIEHFDHPDQHLAEVVRVLRADGVYAVSTPQPGTGGSPEENPHHHHEFSLEGFEELLSRHFSDVVVLGQRRLQTASHRTIQRADVLGLRRLSVLRPMAR
ncbi:MAG: glycosyltransferase, partial [Acidimicrobiales bacterium]